MVVLVTGGGSEAAHGIRKGMGADGDGLAAAADQGGGGVVGEEDLSQITAAVI
jgi:hypothetical protein